MAEKVYSLYSVHQINARIQQRPSLGSCMFLSLYFSFKSKNVCDPYGITIYLYTTCKIFSEKVMWWDIGYTHKKLESSYITSLLLPCCYHAGRLKPRKYLIPLPRIIQSHIYLVATRYFRFPSLITHHVERNSKRQQLVGGFCCQAPPGSEMAI